MKDFEYILVFEVEGYSTQYVNDYRIVQNQEVNYKFPYVHRYGPTQTNIYLNFTTLKPTQKIYDLISFNNLNSQLNSHKDSIDEEMRRHFRHCKYRYYWIGK
jgi:hypothetical protein